MANIFKVNVLLLKLAMHKEGHYVTKDNYPKRPFPINSFSLSRMVKLFDWKTVISNVSCADRIQSITVTPCMLVSPDGFLISILFPTCLNIKSNSAKNHINSYLKSFVVIWNFSRGFHILHKHIHLLYKCMFIPVQFWTFVLPVNAVVKPVGHWIQLVDIDLLW